MKKPLNIYKYCPQCAHLLKRKKINGRKRPFCSICGFIYWNNPKPCVSVILADNDKVLLLQRVHQPLKGYWVLPGGYVEYDESPETSIAREVKEETNLSIRVQKLAGVYLIDNDPRGNSLDLIYKGEVISGQISIKEHSKYKFFSINELPKPIAYKHREAIKNWYKAND